MPRKLSAGRSILGRNGQAPEPFSNFHRNENVSGQDHCTLIHVVHSFVCVRACKGVKQRETCSSGCRVCSSPGLHHLLLPPDFDHPRPGSCGLPEPLRIWRADARFGPAAVCGLGDQGLGVGVGFWVEGVGVRVRGLGLRV